MSRDYINIGSTPADESCQQLGPSYDAALARAECQAFARQLARLWPAGTFGVKGFDHDFGRYYEVVAWWDDESEPAFDAAFAAEAETPATWDDEAKAELAEFVRQRSNGRLRPQGV